MKNLSLILIAAIALSACAHYTEAEKQQRAYDKYVKKSMAKRAKQQARFDKSHPQPPAIPEREVGPWAATATPLAEGPQSVSSGETTTSDQ